MYVVFILCRVRLLQTIHNKPVRWGIKTFCVCCSATAYYFLLFVPMWMFTKIALYTNLKAQMAMEDKKTEGMRHWHPTSSAEIKAWFASVIWWCIIKSFTFEQFFTMDMDAERVRRWFSSSLGCWQQIKQIGRAHV